MADAKGSKGGKRAQGSSAGNMDSPQRGLEKSQDGEQDRHSGKGRWWGCRREAKLGGGGGLGRYQESGEVDRVRWTKSSSLGNYGRVSLFGFVLV